GQGRGDLLPGAVGRRRADGEDELRGRVVRVGHEQLRVAYRARLARVHRQAGVGRERRRVVDRRDVDGAGGGVARGAAVVDRPGDGAGRGRGGVGAVLVLDAAERRLVVGERVAPR